VMVILRLPSEMLVKKLPNIIYGIRVKLTLVSPQLKTQGFYASFYKKPNLIYFINHNF
jgi:hypothetical protein